MSEFTSYSVDNDRKFRKALRNLQKQITDLTIPLTLISKDFFKSQKAIWQLKGPGQYPDLGGFRPNEIVGANGETRRERAKRRKKAEVGFVYPILKRSGALERSMTNPTDGNAISRILDKKDLEVGTKVKNKQGVLYPKFHQSDDPRAVLPLRKFLFIGPEAIRFATNEQKGRLERWLGILEGFSKATIAARGFQP